MNELRVTFNITKTFPMIDARTYQEKIHTTHFLQVNVSKKIHISMHLSWLYHFHLVVIRFLTNVKMKKNGTAKGNIC